MHIFHNCALHTNYVLCQYGIFSWSINISPIGAMVNDKLLFIFLVAFAGGNGGLEDDTEDSWVHPGQTDHCHCQWHHTPDWVLWSPGGQPILCESWSVSYCCSLQLVYLFDIIIYYNLCDNNTSILSMLCFFYHRVIIFQIKKTECIEILWSFLIKISEKKSWFCSSGNHIHLHIFQYFFFSPNFKGILILVITFRCTIFILNSY